jgi:lysophospholipase L1-like esterase
MIEVGREMNVLVIDLHAISMRTVQEIGPVASLELSQKPPPPEVVAAAKSGTSIGAFLPSGYGSATQTEVAATRKSAQHATFDYTHLGAKGAELFASEVAQELLRVAPNLRGRVEP